MALQSSGQISLQDIQDEFGGSHPIQMSEYYGEHSSLPSSGQIAINQFYGLSDALPANFTRTGYYGNQSITLSNAADPYRYIVIAMQDMQGPTLPNLNVPSCNGSSMSEIFRLNSTYSNDGHRIGCWYAHVPTGSSVTISNSTLGFSLYEVTGASNLGSKISTTSSSSYTQPAEQRWTLGFCVTNFANSGAITLNNMTTGHGGSAAIHGYRFSSSSATLSFNTQGNPVVFTRFVSGTFGI